MSQPQISIVIPVLNEEQNLTDLLPLLDQKGVLDVIVVDGGSADTSKKVANDFGATVLSSERGRAVQMNLGASKAQGDILYFIHADARPPKTFVEDIHQAISDGFPIGCYRFKFDSSKWSLKINSYFTRFDRLACRGGDQTLFIKKEIFDAFNGFDEKFRIMEEYDFLLRVRKEHPFKIMPDDVIVSARKYDNNSYLKVNIANLIVFTMFRLGCSQERMMRTYYWWLRQDNYKLG